MLGAIEQAGEHPLHVGLRSPAEHALQVGDVGPLQSDTDRVGVLDGRQTPRLPLVVQLLHACVGPGSSRLPHGGVGDGVAGQHEA